MRAPVDRDVLAEQFARDAHPAAFDGRLEAVLGRMRLFTPEQAAESAERKRREAIDEARSWVDRVLDALAPASD